MSAPISTLEAPRSDAVLSAWCGALCRWRRSGLMLGALILAGCSTAPRIPYTAADETAAVILNMADVRVFADVPAPQFRQVVCANLNLFAAPGHAATPTWRCRVAARMERTAQACSADGRPRGPDPNSRSCLVSVPAR